MTVCSSCGRENPPEARFCNACGAQLAAQPARVREERKIVTCLFCDLVGFTARAERLDPEDVRALQAPYWQRVRSELERFGGTVEKFIGDAVMALFGAPVGHEDDPERAVRAALAIKQWAEEEQSLQVRIGITTGEALVALSARSGEGEGMASGDVVNSAARLQAGAPENGILVDEPTYRATRDRIDYREAEAVHAKGKAAPITAHEAVDAKARFGSDRALADTPLVGRRDEVDLLVRTLARVKRERRPQLVTLVGIPGIGKSRLVAELFRETYDDPDLIHWRQGRSLAYGEAVAYSALAEIVKAQAGILEGDGAEIVESKLETSVDSLLPDEQDRRFVMRHLRTLVGLPGDAAGSGERSTAFAAWTRFVEALAELRPSVLVFEDLQWADDGLLDFVEHLLEWTSEVPLLVIATARPELLERRPTWGGGKTNVATIAVSPLSAEETARLVAHVLERPVLPAETQQELVERAGGNPLFAEQFARLLTERSDAEEPVPETVQAIIGARLDALPSAEKSLLQDAAVIGKVFWLGALLSLNGLDAIERAGMLHALERKELVRRERRGSVSGEQEYAFRHVLVRDVAYGQIPRAARAAKHEAAAAWLSSLAGAEEHAELLAHHYSQALEYARATGTPDPGLEDRAREALRAAGDRAFSLNGFAAAARFYRAALELWPDDDQQRAYVLFALGRALLKSEGADAGVAELQEARNVLLAQRDVDTAAEAEANAAVGAPREVVRQRLQRALALVESRPPSHSKAYVLARHAYFAASNADPVWERYAQEALTMAEHFGRDDLVRFVLQAIGTARAAAGDVESGIEALERAIDSADEADAIEGVALRINLAGTWQAQGELGRAFRLQEESRRGAERFGLSEELLHLAQERVLESYWRGQWADAAGRADEILEEIESGRYHSVAEIGSRHVRAHMRLARGDVVGAIDDAERAVRTAQRSPTWGIHGWAAAAYARALLAAGDVEAARSAARESLDDWKATGENMTYTSVDLAIVLVELERAHELRAAIEAAGRSTHWFDAALAIVEGDYPRAADVYARIGSVPDEADARLRSGDDAQVRRALDFYRSVGATHCIREAEALLAASA